MARELSKAALVVLFSEFETHPLAVLEAISLGRPVLVADTSGLGELAQKGLARAIPLESTSDQIADAVVVGSPVYFSAPTPNVIILETEVWPYFLGVCRRRKIPSRPPIRGPKLSACAPAAPAAAEAPPLVLVTLDPHASPTPTPFQPGPADTAVFNMILTQMAGTPQIPQPSDTPTVEPPSPVPTDASSDQPDRSTADCYR